MYRIFRRACLLAGAGLLIGASAQAAEPDYVLDEEQIVLGVAERGPATGSIDLFDAVQPAIAVAPEAGIALVVMSADDNATGALVPDDADPVYLADDEFEIFGTMVSSRSLDIVLGKGRISTMGNDSETVVAERQRYAALHPAVAWNPVAEEFLVVWEGDDNTAPLVDDEFEIFGQRIGLDGKLVGDRIRISEMGDEAATVATERAKYGAHRPAVAVDPASGHYVVVWHGDSDDAPLVDGEAEVFGRTLDATATPLGAALRISAAGDDAEPVAEERTRYAAVNARIAFNPVSGAFFVAWQQDGIVDGENEIYMQRLSASATTAGCGTNLCPVDALAGPLRISTMGPDGETAYDAIAPDIAVREDTGTVFVVWHGDTLDAPLIDNEFEAHGRMFDANGIPLAIQFRISTMGDEAATDPVARADAQATDVHVAWGAPDNGGFLVIWRGDTREGDLVDNEYEIFGTFVDATGDISPGEMRISVQGDDTEDYASERVLFNAEQSSVAYANGNFIAAWSGDSNPSNDRSAIFGQRIAQNSTQLDLDLFEFPARRQVPDPVKITLRITNTSSSTAANNRVNLVIGDELPFSWGGCVAVVSETSCELGDIGPGEIVDVTLTLTTDHIQYGEPQGTTMSFSVVSDTAQVQPALAAIEFFLGVTLKVEGGSGAVGGALLLLLLHAAYIARRRRAH